MKKSLYLCCLFIFLIATACSKSDSNDPAPAASANFTSSRTVVELDEQIQFTNTSANATRFEWEFGNGQTSTLASPTIQYNQTGRFTVTLKAFNPDNQATTQTTIVTVGRRKLSEIRLVRMAFVTPTGQPWDTDGSGPDIGFEFLGTSRSPSSPPFTGLVGLGHAFPDLTPASLPLVGDLTFNPIEFPLDGNFSCTVKEYDWTPVRIRDMHTATLYTGAPSTDRNALGAGTYTYESPDHAWYMVFSYVTTP
jgi:PKD repeat protein